MSHLIRNILEDTFQLVDDVVANVDGIVSDSVELARRVGRDARRVAGAVREAVVENAAPPSSADAAEPPPAIAASLEHVQAWNPVVMNRVATCAACESALVRGTNAFMGLSDEADAPRTWLCASCRETL